MPTTACQLLDSLFNLQGNSVASFLLVSLTTPSWAITVASVFAIIQVSHLICRPASRQLESESNLRTTITYLLLLIVVFCHCLGLLMPACLQFLKLSMTE